MEATHKLQIDDGLLRLDINGNGLLIFNPSDFNIYQRFFQLLQDLPQIEQRYTVQVEAPPDLEADPGQAMALAGQELERARALDSEVKARLGEVFGPGNDFDVLLNGVNVMALGSNGNRVITNLLDALAPYVEEGARQHMERAAESAKQNREQRRALEHRKNA